MTRCWRSCSRRMRLSSGEASSARVPSGWILPLDGLAKGLSEGAERGGKLGEAGAVCRRRGRGARGERACQAATSLARRARWDFRASRAAPGIWALAASWVGSKRPRKSKVPPEVRKARISRCAGAAGRSRGDRRRARGRGSRRGQGGPGAAGDVIAEGGATERGGAGFVEEGGDRRQ